ncbi:MAG: ribonuclease HII [Deltaproteobacteria bacterium]|nr:ribonuclease HII [Deltaproteobacteria bacterium]
MDSYEKEAFSNGYEPIAGIDEAGRGPLAGPVVASSVILPYPPPLDIGIKDSKKLSPGARLTVLREINRRAVAVGTGIVWPEEIDRINIHNAVLKAMEASLRGLGHRPEFILIDGLFPVDSDIPQLPVVRGDSLSVSIAAASIVAKTTRDKIMEEYHTVYPQYNFLRNKGYGTEEHLAALNSFGPCPIHRRSFKWRGSDRFKGAS